MAHVKRCIIVGVDYGTTYSGVSYAPSGETRLIDIKPLQDWNGGVRDSKVPSKIAYVREPNGAESTRWGYDTRRARTAYCWTKLLLDPLPGSSPGPEDEETFDDQEIRRNVLGDGLLQLPPGKSAEQVVTDYLTELYKFTMAHLEKNLKETVGILPIHFLFTVPAQWSFWGVKTTISAAKKAGFGSRRTRTGSDKLEIIREPEAAAIASIRYLSDMGMDEFSRVKPGAGVLVCDCGGGTVDLVSYRIEAVTPKLVLKQTCVSKGGKCGSTSIDRAFYAFMKREFGDAFTGLRYDLRGPGSLLMQEFEKEKRNLGVSRRRDNILLTFPGLKERLPNDFPRERYDREYEELILTCDEMEELFEPTLEMIKGLIDQQIKQTKVESGTDVDLLLLVGGFGRSPYLYEQVMMWCHENHPNLEPGVINPPIGWEAISLGATLRGLEGAVITERKSRFHIGLEVCEEFVAGLHDGCETFIHKWNGKKHATGLVSWMVMRGDVITPGMVKETHEYTRTWSPGDDRKFSDTLWQSEATTAPYKSRDKTVSKLCEIELDLSDFDMSQFDKTINPLSITREMVYKFGYKYEIKFDDEMGYMSVRTICQGREIGKTSLKFEGQED